jgi:hypothetical protein
MDFAWAMAFSGVLAGEVVQRCAQCEAVGIAGQNVLFIEISGGIEQSRVHLRQKVFRKGFQQSQDGAAPRFTVAAQIYGLDRSLSGLLGGETSPLVISFPSRQFGMPEVGFRLSEPVARPVPHGGILSGRLTMVNLDPRRVGNAFSW